MYSSQMNINNVGIPFYNDGGLGTSHIISYLLTGTNPIPIDPTRPAIHHLSSSALYILFRLLTYQVQGKEEKESIRRLPKKSMISSILV